MTAAAIEMLTAREEMAARLASLKGPEINAASRAQSQAQTAARAAWEAVTEFKGRPIEGEPSRLIQLQEAAQEADRRAEEAESRFKDINREIIELEAHLHSGAAPAVTVEDLLAHQQAVEAAREEVARLEGRVEEITGNLPDLGPERTALREAEQGREQTRADYAEGAVKIAAVQAADKAVGEAEVALQRKVRDLDQQQAFARALAPRVDTARERLEGLEKRTPGLLAAYYEGEGQKAAAAYLKAARQTAAAFARYRALGKLVGRLDSRRRTLTMLNPERLRIPAPAGEEAPGGMIVDAGSFTYDSTIQAAVEVEETRLRDLGVVV